MPAPSVSASVNFKTVSQLAALKALFDGVKEVIDITATFEAQMSRVAAVSQAAGSELEKLSSRARELGASTIFTATEAGQGMEELARLGVNVQEIYTVVQSTLNLAASSALGLGRASEIAAGGLKSFNLEASEASRVADVLALTAASSGANVDSIGEAMAKAGALANTAGVSFEEFNGFVGVLGDRLIKGSEAGTNFRQFLIGLTTETPKGAAALKELGLTYKDVDVTTRGLGPVLRTLESAFDKLGSKQERVSAAADIWGRRQFNAALVAIDSVDKFEKLIDIYDKGSGAVERMADVMTDNLEGSFKLFNSAMQELALTVGGEASPALRELTGQMTESAREFASVEGSARTVGKVLAEIVDAVTILANAFQTLPAVTSIVFTKIIAGVERFEIGIFELFAKLAEGLGADGPAIQLQGVADELKVALDRNIAIIADAQSGIEDNLLNISDAYDRGLERWKTSVSKTKDIKVDLGPLEESLRLSLENIKALVASGNTDLSAEVSALRGVINLSSLFEGIDTDSLSDEQIEGLKSRFDLLIALFREAGLDIDASVIEFRSSLDGVGDVVEKSSEKVSTGVTTLGSALGNLGNVVTTSGDVIKVGSKKVQSALNDIIGFDREEILEKTAAIEGALKRIAETSITLDPSQRENLREQIEGIVSDFAKLKENVPPLIKEAAQSLGIFVRPFQEVEQAAESAEDSVTSSILGMGQGVKTTVESVGELGGSFATMADSATDAAQRSTEVIREVDEVTGEVATSIVANNRDMSDSTNEVSGAYSSMGDSIATSSQKASEEPAKISKAVEEMSEVIGGATGQSTEDIDEVGEGFEKIKEKVSDVDEVTVKIGFEKQLLKNFIEDLVDIQEFARPHLDLKASIGFDDASLQGMLEQITSINQAVIAPKVDTSSIDTLIASLDEALGKVEELEQKAG